MANIFYKLIEEKDWINNTLGIDKADAIKLSKDIENLIELIILQKLKQTSDN